MSGGPLGVELPPASAAPPRKLALVLSGAVSLGSFEAGVLDELLWSLEHLARNGGPRYTIDVMTGASAGSMTAGLVARALMHDFAHREFLYKGWVEEIDVRALTKAIPPNALLNSGPIDSISERYLGGTGLRVTNRPRIAPDTLRMTFMLSNMNGVDFTLETKSPTTAKFTSTFFGERRDFVLRNAAGPGRNVEDPAMWTAIRESAICSGNFPVAFMPRYMKSDPVAVGKKPDEPDFPEKFTYVDGGMFNNEPIREAVRLSADADGGMLDDTRKFLLVDANLNRSSFSQDISPETPLLRSVLRLASMMLGEVGANDWLHAQRVNNEIGWRDHLARDLADMIRSNEVSDPGALLAGLRGSARAIVADKVALFPDRYPAGVDGELARRLKEARTKNEKLLAGLTEGRREIATYMLLVLDNVAGLQKKTKLDIDLIHAAAHETAGDQLFSFGGFFEKKWREHDYRLGRRVARAQLPAMLGYSAGAVPEERRADGRELYKSNGNFQNATMKDADAAQRRILRDAMARKVGQIAKENAPGGAFRFLTAPLVQAGAMKLAGKKLDAVLEL